MRLSDNWFTAFSEDEEGRLISIYGRDELSEFMACGKLKERVEITWPYEGDAHAMPTDEVAERMEVFETTVRKGGLYGWQCPGMGILHTYGPCLWRAAERGVGLARGLSDLDLYRAGSRVGGVSGYVRDETVGGGLSGASIRVFSGRR